MKKTFVKFMCFATLLFFFANFFPNFNVNYDNQVSTLAIHEVPIEQF